MNPSKKLNLNRPSAERTEVESGHHRFVLARKEAAKADLTRSIDTLTLSAEAMLTGLFVFPEDVNRRL
jgi:hypothetical protein